MSQKIISAVVQFVITTYNDAGDPIDEAIAQPIKLFRAKHADLWAHGDELAFSPKEERLTS